MCTEYNLCCRNKNKLKIGKHYHHKKIVLNLSDLSSCTNCQSVVFQVKTRHTIHVWPYVRLILYTSDLWCTLCTLSGMPRETIMRKSLFSLL